jgi:hypothetical protein
MGFLALFLAYPLAVLAHATAPWWKDSWAEWSENSLRKRIGKLKKQLEEYELRYKILDEGQEEILKAVEGVALLTGLAVALLAMLLLLAASHIPQMSRDGARQLGAMALLSAFSAFLVEVVVFGRFSRFRMRRSADYRQTIKESIEKLRVRLERKNAQR